MLVKDSRLFDGWDVEIVGCDISTRCIEHAKAGVYGEHAFRNPESQAMRRWFHLRGGKWAIDETIRRMVRFGQENLLDARRPDLDRAPGRARLPQRDDLLRRRRAEAGAPHLPRKLRDGGWLLLGHSESLINLTADFEIVHLRSDLVYRKPPGGAPGEALP